MATNEERVIAGIDAEITTSVSASGTPINVYEMGQGNCRDACKVEINIDQIEKVYDMLADKIYDDMNRQYKESKISGTQYAETWAKLMSTVISGAISGVVSLQNKETAADRAVKYEQVESSKTKSKNETNVSNAKVANDGALAQSKILLDTASAELTESKKKAEDIKNGDVTDGNSLYGKNKAVLDAQENLYARQKAGFGDNARQKLLDSQLSAWSIVWKEGNGIKIPETVQDKAIEDMFTDVHGNIGNN